MVCHAINILLPLMVIFILSIVNIQVVTEMRTQTVPPYVRVSVSFLSGLIKLLQCITVISRQQPLT